MNEEFWIEETTPMTQESWDAMVRHSSQPSPWPHLCEKSSDPDLYTTTEPQPEGGEPQRWQCQACKAFGGRKYRKPER